MVVTVEPLKPYVDDILKGVTTATSLFTGGQDPHIAALSPSQARALKDADIIIMPSQAMAPKLARILAEKKKSGAILLELTELAGADPLPNAPPNPWLEAQKNAAKPSTHEGRVHDEHGHHEKEHNHEEEHAHEATATHAAPDKKTRDPHVWLDPLRMAAIATPLANALGGNEPHYRATFAANAKQLARHLREEVDPAIRRMLSKQRTLPEAGSKPFVPLLTYHSAYQYFLHRYRLDDAGFLVNQPEETLGARSARTAITTAQSIRLRCLVSENTTSLVRRIAEHAGARIVTLNPERGYGNDEVGIVPWAKNDYERLLYKVAEGFSGCL